MLHELGEAGGTQQRVVARTAMPDQTRDPTAEPVERCRADLASRCCRDPAPARLGVLERRIDSEQPRPPLCGEVVLDHRMVPSDGSTLRRRRLFPDRHQAQGPLPRRGWQESQVEDPDEKSRSTSPSRPTMTNGFGVTRQAAEPPSSQARRCSETRCRRTPCKHVIRFACWPPSPSGGAIPTWLTRKRVLGSSVSGTLRSSTRRKGHR